MEQLALTMPLVPSAMIWFLFNLFKRPSYNAGLIFSLFFMLDVFRSLFIVTTGGPSSLFIVVFVCGVFFLFIVPELIRYPAVILEMALCKGIVLALSFFVVMCLSLFFTDDYAYGLDKAMTLLVRGILPGIVIWLGFRLNEKFDFMPIFPLAMICGASVVFWGERPFQERLSLYGLNPIWTARILFICATIALFNLRKRFRLSMCAFLIAMTAALMTRSRGPLLVFVISLGVDLLLTPFRNHARKYAVSGYLCGGFFLLGSFALVAVCLVDIPDLLEWVLGRRSMVLFSGTKFLSDVNVLGRFEFWQASLSAAKSSPWLGLGLGGLSVLGGEFYPHNILVEIFAELGVLGLSVWFVWALYTLFTSFQQRVLFVVFLQSIGFAMLSGDLGHNYEMFLIAFLIYGIHHHEKAKSYSGI